MPTYTTQIWEKMYGFIVPTLKKGVIIGEWGGNCKGTYARQSMHYPYIYIHAQSIPTPQPHPTSSIHTTNTNTGKDQVVQYLLGDWLKKKCMANNVWWALNPGSDDTGGLLAVRFLLGLRA